MFPKLLRRNEHHAIKKRPVSLSEQATCSSSTTDGSAPSTASSCTIHQPASAQSMTGRTTTSPSKAPTASKNERGKPRSDIIQHVSVGSVATPINIAPSKKIACCICNLELKPGSHVKLPCKHAAHANCANDWLNRDVLYLKPGCPTCSGEPFEKNPYSISNAVILSC